MTRREYLLALAAQAAAAVLPDDPHRPGYHFLPPANWMNDPNGLIYWKGQYHLFYQYNPNGAFWGTMHWGHASSPDLVHWRQLPIALAPTPGGPDKGGVFSGCAVVDRGVPTFIFTGTKPEVQCIATSRDDLKTIQKYSGNPVIAGPPADLRVTAFRDPWVWREGDSWLMALGSGLEGGGGTVLLYESRDLRKWQYRNALVTGDPEQTGRIWECPNFFPLGDKHVLLVSSIPLRKALYFTGSYAGGKFTPERQGTIDDGGSFYAPQTMPDSDGRRVMFGWIQENRSKEAQLAAGWSGVQTVPRVLSLRADGTLGCAPHPNLEKLRSSRQYWRDVGVNDVELPPVDGIELAAEIDLRGARRIGLRVRMSPDEREATEISFDAEKNRLAIDRTRSSLGADTTRDVRDTPLYLAPGEPLRLRVFLDRSVIEVYANERVAMTTRVYPTLEENAGMHLFGDGGRAHVNRLDIWRMG